MERTVITDSAEETAQLGEDLAARLRPGDVVALVGDLGAGKTTLVQGLARGLFVAEAVLSPSYVLGRSYPGRLPLHHLDAYRIGDPQELIEAGLGEVLPSEDGVTVVEWGDRVADLLPVRAIWVHLTLLEGDRRRIAITAPA